MIPKIIHYCWFGGGPLPELAKRCIASWKKYCLGYEIREWNEKNFNMDYCAYVKEAYLAKKWAFVSDVARLYALVQYGGIYMDTDMEVLKPLDDLLEYEAVSGFEDASFVMTSFMACKAGDPLFCELLHEYDGLHFQMQDGKLDYTTNVQRITRVLEKYGLRLDGTEQTIRGMMLFPQDYFSPKNWKTGDVYTTDATYTIHHFATSWLSEEEKLQSKLMRKFERYIPSKLAGHITAFLSILKIRGASAAVRESVKWFEKQ